MKALKYLSYSIILMLTIVSCEDLVVENLNDPDFETAMASASDVKASASGLYSNYFIYNNNYDGLALGMWTMADAGTCSWGNAGMQDLSSEPRVAFDNTQTYGYADINITYYGGMYATLSLANDVLSKTINDGLVIEITEGTDDTPLVNAFAYLNQGITLGYLGLNYDQAFVTTEATDLEGDIPISSYDAVIDSAIASLDKCIAVCEANSFDVPYSWLAVDGTSIDQDALAKIANSYAARILAYAPRNATQNDAVDWQSVYDYASAGLDFDLTILCDANTWWSDYHIYANYTTWGRTDMRVVHMMDPDMPSTWPDGGFDDLPDPPTTYDAAYDNRLIDNFEYLTSNNFKEARGKYHYSCYRFKKMDQYIADWYVGDVDEFLVAENDMLKAEAAMYLGKLDEAESIINNGTRVTKGGLAEISATEDEISDAIFHERMVELFNTTPGIEFYAMRKADLLQEGTMLHWPIPGKQLSVMQMDYYTFGGTTGVAGEDYSNGGWK